MRNKYITVPLIFGIGQTIIYAVLAYFSNGGMQFSTERIISNFIIATAIGFVLVLIHHLSAPKDQAANNIGSAKYQKLITIILPYEQAFSACKEALKLMGSRIVEESYRNGIIKAKVGISWKSFGEVVDINLLRRSDNLTEIDVRSRSTVPTTLIDYGKNLENIEKISDHLAEHSSSILQGVKIEEEANYRPRHLQF